MHMASSCKKNAIIGGQHQKVLGTSRIKRNPKSRVSVSVHAFKESSQLQDWRVKEMVEVRVGTLSDDCRLFRYRKTLNPGGTCRCRCLINTL